MTLKRKLSHEPMLEIYVCETEMFLEHLEAGILDAESIPQISNEIMASLLTEAQRIKSASAMMLFPEIASAADVLETLMLHFEAAPSGSVNLEACVNLVWETMDFIKREIKKAAEGFEPDGSAAVLHSRINDIGTLVRRAGEKKTHFPEEQKYYITQAQGPRPQVIRCYHAKIHFEKNCQMENIRAFTVVHNLRDCCHEIYHQPEDLISDSAASAWIVRNGLELFFSTDMAEHEIRMAIEDAILIQEYMLEQIDSLPKYSQESNQVNRDRKAGEKTVYTTVPPLEKAESLDMNWRRAEAGFRAGFVSVQEDKFIKLAELAADILLVEAELSEEKGTDIPLIIQQSIDTLRILTRNLYELVEDIEGNSKRLL